MARRRAWSAPGAGRARDALLHDGARGRGYGASGAAEWFRSRCSTGAERDDAADRVVGGDTDRHAITGDNFDSETAHAAAQLGEHFVARITLHAVQPAGVHGDDGSLHIYQIVFAQ